ncbi:NADH-quinone oxidoreductase subunit B family protein [Methylovirgula sp. HY1]|uniref:NADH-quinone oxidoreductase subunit B family protein n=1 Tax=Methylovirgula sp. HY1 TaxID=2822761 RepID=UPI001C5AA2AC|nr:NADH-quinone oxidoreductase subunit B family protein [Methylovirgula sp. HY1]QXX76556.1 Formate hydrogenlyase subunit 7 [Methylovirgula sp. HY1]
MRKTLFESLTRRPFTEKLVIPTDPDIARMASELDVKAQRRLGRSLSLRLVDAGSCNACELELNALSNPYYDLERFGLRFVASPRHADVLLVTGPVTKNMREALLRTYDAMPAPKWVVAVGDCAACGGLYDDSYACERGADAVLPVDLRIIGCPPSPNRLLEGLLALFSS